MPGETIRLIDPQGEIRDVPIDAAGGALDGGWRVPTSEQEIGRVAEQAREINYGGVAGGIKAGAAALARGASLGLSDVAARALGGDDAAIALEGLREQNRGISIAGEVVGGVAPALVTAGAATPAGLAARAGRAVTGLGAEAGVLGRVGAAAAGGTVEGALFGAGTGVSELALSDDPLTVERIASTLSSHTLFGAGVGGLIGGAAKGAELGLRRAKGALDTALEKRAISKARTPAEAIETGDLSLVDNKILDAAERSEIERIRVEQAPQRKAFTDELDTWRRANRDAHDLRAITQGSDDVNLSEASGAFDRANIRLRAALDDRVGFAEDPVRSLKVVRTQGQALEEMRSAARAHEARWRQDVADAPVTIRSALEEVSALGRSRVDIPEYRALRSQLDSAGEDYLEQTVPARALAEHGYYEPPGAGVDKVRVAKARRAIEEGQREPITLLVTPSGKIVVENGRHRLAAAAKGGHPINVKWSTGYEPSPEMVLRSKTFGGADLLAARKKLAAELGLGDEIGPFTEAGLDAPTERVLKDRMTYQWGGAIKGGLREPSIVSRIPKIEDMIAANQRLQSQLEVLAKPPTSDLLTKIADARAVLNAPKEPSLGQVGQAMLGAAAPFAGPVGVAAAAGNRVIGSFKKIAEAATARAGKAASAFLGVAAPATYKAAPVATRILSSLRYGDDPKPTGKTLPELFEARTREVKEQAHVAADGSYQMRPEARAKMAAKFDGIRVADPRLADQLETAGARRIAYLASIMPRLPDMGLMPGLHTGAIAEFQMRSWARAAKAIDDPDAVFERAAHGDVMPEEVAAIRAVWPGKLDSLIQEVVQQVATRKTPLSYEKRFALSMLTGKPFDPAFHPAVLNMLQGQFVNDEGGPATQAPTAAAAFGSVKKSAPGPTPAQRREQGGATS